MTDGMILVFRMDFFYGLVNSNKIHKWINENVVTLGETCFGIFVEGFGQKKVLMSRQLCVVMSNCFFCKSTNLEGC